MVGPIAGPILACQQFGWLPCVLWIGLGAVFIGAVHDFDAGHARELGHLRGRGRQVEAHHVVDHDSVGKPVVKVGHRGQRVRATVHGAEVFLERDRAHHRAHQHVAACREVPAVAKRDR